MTYKVDGVLPGALAAELDPGTNLLLSGPPMSGKRSVLLDVLARGEADQQGSVVVTSRDPADDVIEEYERVLGTRSKFLRLVDCVSSQTGDTTVDERVRYVSTPGDLTGMGIEFSEVARSATESGVSELRVGFDSLSPLLMYVDLQRLFRFLHVFTSQIQSRDWLGVFSIDPESHDDQTTNTIGQLFDGVLELRMTGGGGREARIRGITDAPTGWVAVE